LEEYRKKYEALIREKSLIAIERDKLRLKVKSLEETIKI
jgi:hypothetical protein